MERKVIFFVLVHIEKGVFITHVDEESPTVKDYRYIIEKMLRGPAYVEIDLTVKRTSTSKRFSVTLDHVESKGAY
jgi:hypothetical protein